MRILPYKSKSRYKTDRYDFKAWMKSKNKQEGTSLFYVCFWISFSLYSIRFLVDGQWAYKHVTNFLHGFSKKPRPNKEEIDLLMGNGEKVKV